jgi:Holliday junction resolvase RusA-like endonuclease
MTSPGVRRWDVENRVKVLSDLLTRMAFWGDDSQVWELVVTRKEGRPERTEVTIAPFREGDSKC